MPDVRPDRALLVARIERLLAEQGLRPGERLGSERGLAESLGVTRSALRDALDVLAGSGRVRRVMGRSGGVYASDGRIERRLNTIEGVPALLRQQGVGLTTVVLRADLGLATPPERRALRLPEDGVVVRVRRRRDAGGRPWSLERSTFPAVRVPGILERDLSGSLYELLGSGYDASPVEAEEEVDVRGADADAAAHLDLAEGEPVLHVWRVASTADGLPIELGTDLFRADRTRLHLRRYGASWKRSAQR
ncbi:GntR family transcriptional regulator [Nocardioides sp. GY 10127]|uniref:GntR family transcriptional regulator n=1 Tax=Nocardioides sp. GY 10127 TaxID=2569762 RepID=UPI0010A8EE8C|nr:GntR family transcriptional regulator [Nocardioides sp. GY 10127]TIC79317.1 GntR family transcriptional regulator [Nocardioides sp. GY 10127]